MNIIKKDKSFTRSLKLFSWLNATTDAFYVFAVIYFVDVTDSYLLTTILFAVKKVSTILSELPTWVISDKYLGRKWTYISWQILLLSWLCLYLLWNLSYNFLIIWSILIWISTALHSWNMSAMLHDILKKLWKEKLYQKYNWESNWVRLWIISAETLIAWLLYLYNPIFVLIIAILKVFSGLILSIFIKEAYEFKKAETLKESWQHFTSSLIFIIRNRKLRLLSFISVVRKSLFNVVDEIWFEFYHKFYSTLWIWIIFSISAFIAGFWSWFTKKITDKFGYFKTFIWAEITWIFINCIAFIFPTKLSPIMIESSANCWVIVWVSERTLLQKEFTDKQRATMESIISIFIALFSSVLIILIWWLADEYSLQFALLIVVLSRLIMIPFYFKFFRKSM